MGSRSTSIESDPDSPDLSTVSISKMSSTGVKNGGDHTSSGFKESLRFFKSQVDKVNVPSSNGSDSRSIRHKINLESAEAGLQYNGNVKTTSSVPSVDNILSNVKNICTNTNKNSNFTSVYSNNQVNDVKDEFHSRTRSNESHSNEINQTKLLECTTRSEQVYTAKKLTICNSKKASLLSNFNPSYEGDNPDFVESSIKSTSPPAISRTVSQLKPTFLNNNNNINVKNDVITEGKISLENQTSRDVSAEKSHIVQVTKNRTFGHCKEKLLNGDRLPNREKTTCDEKSPQTKSNPVELPKQIDDPRKPEEQTEPFESDYDSKDFVVHKAAFSEDYLDAMSEDNFSSFTEEYEVEHPDDRPNIPSPDYNSDDESYTVQNGDEVPQYEDVEFIDNTAQYLNDPRRYIYYADDKELEVIPEEDEEDIEEDDDTYSNEDSNTKGYNPLTLGGYTNQNECDSGLTDDQRSSSSTTGECDLEDDTDSAKGSLPLQDSSSDSPTGNNLSHMDIFEKPKNKRKVDGIYKSKIREKILENVTNGVHESFEDEDVKKSKFLATTWDPQELIRVLYRLDFSAEPVKKQQIRYINKEGFLEKLPSGRKKATYWNPWKSKYIRLKNGFLFCFDNMHAEKPSMTLQLMGGRIDSLDSKMLGVDDQKGHYVVLRCLTVEETESWENALHSQCEEDFVNAYTSPCLYPLPISKNIIIIDLGSCSVRAGVLMSSPTLPQVFFPTACSTHKISQNKIFGVEALRPSVRKDCHLSFPLHPSAKVAKYSIDVSILPHLLKHVFCELNVRPENYRIQLSMPRNLSLQTKIKIARMLLDDFRVKGVNLTHQAILSLHAYNSKSGIIVDIGDRLDVIPIIEGYIVESGVTRLPYGGQRMIHHLKHALAEKNVSVVSDVETYLARYILEQLCYVAEEYNEEFQRYLTNPDDFEMSISTSHFFKEDCPWEEVILDHGRFHVPEGLFNPERWGLDNPGLHKLVHHAIQECGVDLRREMSRSIYVSGGVTLLPGFVERLETEVDKLTPNTITPKVHASPYRYHMSYIGACQIALSDKFEEICITKQMWKKEGNTCVKKWHI